mgnify:CR=1 FL=1
MIDISFDEMNVETLFNNAAIANGANAGFGWDSHAKQNKNVNLSEFFSSNLYDINILVDNDILDRAEWR